MRIFRMATAAGLAAFTVVSVMALRTAAQQVKPPVTPNLEKELKVVRGVLDSADMQKAIAYIESSRDETLQEFLQVCNANAPSQDEWFRARLLQKLLLIYGLENVHIDDERNVIGIRRGLGKGPTVVLDAHYDNIRRAPKEQPVEAFIADGRVWCPGASDDIVGVIQVLTALRAMNAANIQTQGDVWFAFFTNEEPLTNQASSGAGYFVESNYPLNLDWKNGDILVQLHGGGGEGVTTGNTDMRHRPMLRVFAPMTSEWGPWNANEVLARILVRITKEVRDTREAALDRGTPVENLLLMNPSQIESSTALNGPTTEASIRFDMHTLTEERLWQADRQIMQIAKEVCAEFGKGCTYHFTVNNKNGAENGLPGWNLVENAPARYAAAASQALYGKPGVIEPAGGCGDCVRAMRNGMPAMSLRGDIIDHGKGKIDLEPGRSVLQSQTRRATANHTVTGSAEIDTIWAGTKHGLLFAVSYAGLGRGK
jgi:tripeptide aminopeptidase